MTFPYPCDLLRLLVSVDMHTFPDSAALLCELWRSAWVTLKVHGDHAGGDQGHANKLPMGWNLSIQQPTNQHDGHDADAAPEGVGEAHGEHLHDPRHQGHRDGIGRKHDQCGAWSAEPLRELEAGGADHLGTDRQQQEQPGVG